MEQQFPEKTYQNFRDPTPVNPGPQARRICFTEVRTESNRPLLHVPVSIAFSRGMKDAVFRSVANLPTVAVAVPVAPLLLRAGAVIEVAGLFTS